MQWKTVFSAILFCFALTSSQRLLECPTAGEECVPARECPAVSAVLDELAASSAGGGGGLSGPVASALREHLRSKRCGGGGGDVVVGGRSVGDLLLLAGTVRNHK